MLGMAFNSTHSLTPTFQNHYLINVLICNVFSFLFTADFLDKVIVNFKGMVYHNRADVAIKSQPM